MRFFRSWRSIPGIGLCALVLLVGCAGKTRHEWLTLFFDDVPPEAGSQSSKPAVRTAGGSSTNAAPDQSADASALLQ
ncbi:MAG TPA: hypothetical protein VK327_08060, partial [Candidatus Paceibacterota bacterium]|nr:hypothetical protein [Candidatus Paceibacterota bacterium]